MAVIHEAINENPDIVPAIRALGEKTVERKIAEELKRIHQKLPAFFTLRDYKNEIVSMINQLAKDGTTKMKGHLDA